MRSALLAVKGVTRARVTLEDHQAVVTYDSQQASTDDLRAAVSKAQGPLGQQYTATVKPEK